MRPYVFLKLGTYFYALLKSGLGKRHTLTALFEYALCKTIYLFLIYAIYLVFRRPYQVREFFFLIIFCIAKESEKDDKFNCTLQHVEALLRFVKGVYLPSSSKELS